ncbi:type VI secretion system baseplate subunit TssK [Aquitalea sp.]|uniref:type VI secretion system baseplate subunit TssK n=1 Tax=Aquitalea sp. TaxID=1872623 RepID=UPI002589F3C6|nr:type VI secretion system baseplate subunit TssK [Aquitalea sp.]
MRIHKPLWHEGILLLPQLFQQQETMQAAQRQQLAELASPFPWGLSAILLDERALDQGQVRLDSLAGIFPDGSAFDQRLSGHMPSPRHLDELPATLDSVTVWLALPALNPMGNNLHLGSVGPADIPRRYRQSFARVADHMGEQEDELAVEQLNLLLKFDGESLDGMSKLPLARLQRNAQNRFVSDPDFIPPLLCCHALPALQNRLQQLSELLQARQDSLQQQRRERTQQAADYLLSDISLLWLMNTLGQCWPELRMLSQLPGIHPYSAYLCLSRLAGMLCTFALERQLNDIPVYTHQQLGTVFGQLDSLIRDLLDTVIPTPVVLLPLQRDGANLWIAHLEDPRLREGADFYLSVHAAMPLHLLQEQLPKVSKAGAPEDVARIMSSALNGIPLRPMQRLPTALPSRVDSLYFALDAQHPAFAAMLAAQSCAFYFPSSLPELQLALYAVPRP